MSDWPERIVAVGRGEGDEQYWYNTGFRCDADCEYVRGDLYDALHAENERLREALEFYANLPEEWTINAGPDLVYGSLYLLGEKARGILARQTKGEG